MTDVIERLAQLRGSSPSPSEEIVAADLDRAHAALARRRHGRAALAGVGLTLALGTGLGAIVLSQQPGPAVTDDPATGVELVTYEEEPPRGFDIAKIPEGFFAQGSRPFSFTIARHGDNTHPDAFVDKLVVTLESGLAPVGKLVGEPVTVNGHPGAVRDAGEAVTLEFHDGTHEVVVQMWKSVGLTTVQLVEFAEGVTVTPDARRGEVPDGSSDEIEVIEKDGKRWVKVG